MRALVLFYNWGHADECDPIAIIPESVWENVDDEAIEEMFDVVKNDYKILDDPPENFRRAWVSLSGAGSLFRTPTILGNIERDKADDPQPLVEALRGYEELDQERDERSLLQQEVLS